MIAIALVLSAVFVPVAFVPGITGRLYQQFALTIAISVIISAFNALTLSPALSSLLLRPTGTSTGWLGRFFAAFNRGFDRATEGYVGYTGVCVRRAGRTLIGLVVLTAAAGLLGWKLPGGFVPDEDQGYLFVNVQLPDAASLQRTDAVCKKVEAILAEQRRRRRLQHGGGLQPDLPELRHLQRILLRVARAVGRATQTRRPASRRSSPALNRKFAAIPGRAGLRVPAAGDPGHRHRRRLLGDAPGPQRRLRRLPREESPEVRAGRAQAARARQRLQPVPRLGAAGLRRGRPRQGAQARRRPARASTPRCRPSWAAPT